MSFLVVEICGIEEKKERFYDQFDSKVDQCHPCYTLIVFSDDVVTSTMSDSYELPDGFDTRNIKNSLLNPATLKTNEYPRFLVYRVAGLS